MSNKKLLVLDFDGVIHSYESGWSGAAEIRDAPVVGSIAFLEEALNFYEVAIYSSRSHQPGGIKAMQEWLLHWALLSASIEQDENDNIIETSEDWTREWLQKIQWPTFKPPAFLTIDDRAITFRGSFPDVEELQFFKPWNK